MNSDWMEPKCYLGLVVTTLAAHGFHDAVLTGQYLSCLRQLVVCVCVCVCVCVLRRKIGSSASVCRKCVGVYIAPFTEHISYCKAAVGGPNSACL